MSNFMTKRWITAPVATVLTVIVAACTSSSGSPSPTGSSSPASSAPAKSAPATTEPAASPSPQSQKIDFGGASIKIAANGDYLKPDPKTPIGQKKAALQAAAEKKYNVKIEYVTIPQAELLDKMKASILNGSPVADMWYVGSPDTVPSLAAAGMLIPLDDMLPSLAQEKDIPVADFTKLTGFKGKTYGFNSNSQVDQIGIYYNRKIFQKEGLPDPHELVKTKEWTWDKFREYAIKLTKDTNGDGKPDQWGLTGYAGDWVWFQALAYGGKIYDAANGKQTLDDPKTQQAMDFMAKLFTQDKVVADATWAFLDLFPKGNIAMLPSFSWVGGGLKQPMGDSYGFLPMPLGPGQTDYIDPARQVSAYFMAKGVKNPAAVLQVWKELQVYDNNAILNDYVTAQYANEDDIEVAKMLGKNVNFDFFAGVHGGLIDTIGNELATGKTTAAQAAQKYGPQLQNKIDIIVKK